MKALKLILVFVLILGGVVGAFFLLTNSGGGELPPPPDNTYETYRKQFVTDWESKNDWDEAIFRNHCDIVHQLDDGKYSIGPLIDLNIKTASEIVHKKIFEEWKSATCRKPEIERLWKAIAVITKEDAEASIDPNIKQIKDVYGTYTNVYNIAHKSIGLTAKFDGSSWNSYDSYSNGIKSQKNSMLGNTNYKQFLSNINDIKNGLRGIDGKLSSGRTAFYNSLAGQIVRHFRSIPSDQRNRSQLNSLTAARNNFEKETSANNELNSFVRTFRNDVDNNEENQQ